MHDPVLFEHVMWLGNSMTKAVAFRWHNNFEMKNSHVSVREGRWLNLAKKSRVHIQETTGEIGEKSLLVNEGHPYQNILMENHGMRGAGITARSWYSPPSKDTPEYPVQEMYERAKMAHFDAR